MTYCWKCLVCGYKGQSKEREPAPECPTFGHGGTITKMVRDYKAEGVALELENLRKARE